MTRRVQRDREVRVQRRDLQLFRRIIEEHADILRSSYREYLQPDKKRGPIGDSATMFIHREYEEMLTALRTLDKLLIGKEQP